MLQGLLQKGTAVKVLGHQPGEVAGYAVADNTEGETEFFYVIQLREGGWIESKSLFITSILALPENVQAV